MLHVFCVCYLCKYYTVSVVLGDVSSGKSTLVDRLCQVSKSYPMGGKYPLSGCSLEYRFIDVQDEETDGEFLPIICPMNCL